MWPFSSGESVSVTALTYRGTSEPSLQETTVKFTENHLLVKVTAASLNPIDIKLATSPVGWTIPGQKGVGKDFAGVIEKVGSKCDSSKWKVGDRVMGKVANMNLAGTIATYVVVNPTTEAVLHTPSSFSDAQGAAVPLVFETSYDCLHYNTEEFIKDSNVLILGGSTACGIIAIQLAKKCFGAANVTVTCSPAKNELLRELGADTFIDYKSDVVDELRKFVSSSGKKYDIIYDCVGGRKVLDNIDDILAPKQTGSYYVTIVGDEESAGVEDGVYKNCGGPLAYFYKPGMLMRHIRGSCRYICHIPPATGETWHHTGKDIISRPDFKVIIDSEYKLQDWKQAWDRLASRRALGKVIIRTN